MRVFTAVVVVLSIVGLCAQATVVSTCNRPCKSQGAKVLFWGLTPTNGGSQTIVQWLNANIGAATFDQIDPDSAGASLTSALLANYDLIVLSELFRSATNDEAHALANWVNSGGFFFGMSGWYNAQIEVDYTNSYLQYINGLPQYYCAPTSPRGDCTVDGCSAFYPNQPLLAGIAECNIDFLGGYPGSYPVNMSSEYDYTYMMISSNPVGYNLGLSVDLCNGNNPTGGRYVLWGDEWISYTNTFQSVAGDEQIWFNIINYLGICVPQAGCVTDSDCSGGCTYSCQSGQCVQCANGSCKTVDDSCTSTSFTYSGKNAALLFSSTATGC